ncbi:hypothetical protein AYO41_04495 [Verrucomicrobia bacterium SCGC AG-212-E04]|nr:hypothetical protein AYO41_04495 [Verrucomicrobia bacterium SCGC AG-212-E04]
MKFLPSLVVACCLATPGALFGQAPAAPAPAASPAKTGSSPAKGKAKQATPEPNATFPAEIDAGVIEILRKAHAAQRAKGSFRAQIESSAPGGAVLPSMVMEVVIPDRVRLKRSGVEIIAVGSKAMVRKGDVWEPAPPEIAKAFGSFDDPKAVEEMLGKSIFAKSLGQARLEQTVVDSYELHFKTKTGVTKSKFFITPDDNLIRRLESKTEVGGKTASATLVFADYGAPIQIELPK